MMLHKLTKKLSEFRQADRKFTWLYYEFKWRYFAYRHRPQVLLNLAYDREHGVETATELFLEAAGVPQADVSRGNVVYRPLTEQLFRAALDSVQMDVTLFTFVDIGSGKGKVLFMAAERPFRRILGIEYAPGLHEVAVRNIAQYRSYTQKCRVIESVHADALHYPLPDGPLMLFIFNSLSTEFMRALLLSLDHGVAAEPDRPVVLIYTNLRTVSEVRGAFDGLTRLKIARRTRNYVVIANPPAALTAAR